MIYDTLNNLPNYLGLCSSLDSVIEFIMARDINNLPAGRTRIGSTMIMRSLGIARNTLMISRFAAKLLPEPVEPRYRPLADFSFLRSAMMTLWERAFMP